MATKLIKLIEDGMSDSAEADRLRDEMDPLWYALSEEEKEEAKKKCAELNKR